MTATETKHLERQATALLRRNGFTWSGRDRKDVDCGQSVFERKVIIAGHCGKSTRH